MRGLQTHSDAAVPFEPFERLAVRVVKITESLKNILYSWHNLSTQCGLFWFRKLLDGTLFEVNNPYDRVYAYIGIAMDITSWASTDGRGCGYDRTTKFPIDYKNLVSVVYQDLVKHLINRDVKLRSLQICESRLNRKPDLPS